VVSQTFSTEDYFTSRKAIGEVLHAAVNARLKEFGAFVEHFQLRRVVPPTRTDDSILAKLVQQQRVQTVTQVQQSTLVRTATSVISNEAQQLVVVINSRAARDAQLITQQAQALAIEIKQNATAEAYAILKDQLNFTSTELLKYVWIDNLRNLAPTDKLFVDVDTAVTRL